MKALKRFLKYSAKAMKWIFIAFLAFVFSLFFREQSIPMSLVDSFAAKLPFVMKCDGVFFGFRKGLSLANVRIYDSEGGKSMRPLLSASSIAIDPLARRVSAVRLKYARLPESYYLPEWHEKKAPCDFRLFDAGDFSLVLVDCDILGLVPRRVSANISVSERRLAAEDVRIDWPERGEPIVITGRFELDLETQKILADVDGSAFQSQIRPFLVALDIPVALPYMDAFTEIETPVAAKGKFDVNLVNNDFRMKLLLKPKMGCYNGVAMSYAEGTLDLYSYIRGTNSNVKFSVDLPLALDREGCRLSGAIKVDYSNDVTRLAYDVRSSLRFEDALAIADFIDPAAFSVFRFDTPPQLTVKGTSGTSAADKAANDLSMNAAVGKMSFLDFRLVDANADFNLKGDMIDFPSISAFGKTGGRIGGTAKVYMPDFDEKKMSFDAHVVYDGGSLEELADFLRFDLGERRGQVTGEFSFSGPIATNAIESLNGAGKIDIKEGHLAQMKLFAGLTAILAEKVPGVGAIVNQSSASADFTITNGIFASDNVYIEGGLISLKAWGTYDIPKDNLDFTVRVRFLKNESMVSKLVHPITWPFTKLLLEFKAKGPIDNPAWDYVSIIDRVL